MYTNEFSSLSGHAHVTLLTYLSQWTSPWYNVYIHNSVGKPHDTLCIKVHPSLSGRAHSAHWPPGHGTCTWTWSRGTCCPHRVALRAPGAYARTLPRVGGGSSNSPGCPIPHPPVPSGDDSLGTVSVKHKIHKFYILISINHKHVTIEEDVSTEHSHNESIREVSMKCKIKRLT